MSKEFENSCNIGNGHVIESREFKAGKAIFWECGGAYDLMYKACQVIRKECCPWTLILWRLLKGVA